MLFAGFNVSEGNLTLFGIVAAGVLGNLVGSLIAYAVGYYGRIELLDRNRLIHINRRHLDSADRWFERHGPATVFFARMLPIIRTFISLPAGVARMPLGRFIVFTVAGCIPWVLMLAIIGREVGDRLGPVEGLPALRRLCGRRRDRDRRSPTCSSGGAAGAPSGSRRPRPEHLLAADGLPRRAAVLGVVQGPAELLPVSSSAHLSLLPWLAGWRWSELDPESRKSFEVALHAGAAAALLIGQRRVIADELRAVRRPARRGGRALLRAAGDRRLPVRAPDRAAPRAARAPPPSGLLAGAVAMAVADRRPQLRGPGDVDPHRRPRPGPRPGHRARARRLAQRRDARGRALAALHRAARQPPLAHRRPAGDRRRDPAQGRPAAAPRRRARPAAERWPPGVAASFASTLASQKLIDLVERDRALWPYAAYRIGLAGAVLV